MRVIARVPCNTRDDVKYAEARLIQSIPAEQRLNVQMPRYDLSRVVNREAIEAAFPSEESKTAQTEETKEQLPSIRETETEYSLMENLTNKPKLLDNAFKQVDDIKAYLDSHNGVYPSRRSTDKKQHAIATAIECIRKEIRGKKTTAVTKDRLAYLKRVIPNFKVDGVDLKFQNSVDRLRDFYTAHNRIPRYGGPEQDEKIIYGFMQRIKQAYQEKDEEYVTPDRLEYIRE